MKLLTSTALLLAILPSFIAALPSTDPPDLSRRSLEARKKKDNKCHITLTLDKSPDQMRIPGSISISAPGYRGEYGSISSYPAGTDLPCSPYLPNGVLQIRKNTPDDKNDPTLAFWGKVGDLEFGWLSSDKICSRDGNPANKDDLTIKCTWVCVGS